MITWDGERIFVYGFGYNLLVSNMDMCTSVGHANILKLLHNFILKYKCPYSNLSVEHVIDGIDKGDLPIHLQVAKPTFI